MLKLTAVQQLYMDLLTWVNRKTLDGEVNISPQGILGTQFYSIGVIEQSRHFDEAAFSPALSTGIPRLT